MSSSTLEAYTLDVSMVSQWAADRQQDLLRLTTADLARYIAERLDQGTQSSTLSRHISSCRSFYAFLLQEGVVPINPAASVPVPHDSHRESAPVPNDALRVLLRSPTGELSTPVSTYRRRRNHAIVYTLYRSGLGISDVRLLRWEQIDDQLRTISVPIPGGRMARAFEVDTGVLAVLKALRACMTTADLGNTDGDYCFATTTGSPMSRQALCHVVRSWARERGEAGVVTPSALRRAGKTHRATRRGSGNSLAWVRH